MNKIHIIGISGSGKSHLANILSNKLNIPKFDLDDIYYETKYSKIRDKIKRKEIISQIIKENNDWIIEGVYNSWTEEIPQNADIIIWLDLPKNLLSFRIIKRAISEKRKNIKELLNLLEYQRSYHKIRKGKKISKFVGHTQLVECYKNKLIKITSEKEVKKYLNILKNIN